MAAPVQILDASDGSTDAAQYTFTADRALAANELGLLYVYPRGAVVPTVTSIVSMGLTWVEVISRPNSTTIARVSVWRAMGASPSGTSVEINLSAACTSLDAHLIAWDEADTTGTDGSGAIVQDDPDTSTTAATSGSVTLTSNLGSVDNLIISGKNHVANEATTVGADSTTTELADTFGSAANRGCQTQYRAVTATTQTITSWSWATSSRWCAVAIEVKKGSLAVALAGTTAGASTSVGAIKQERPLAGLTTGLSTSDATLLVLQGGQLSGLSVGLSVSTGALSVTMPLAATTTAASTSAGVLVQARPLVATSVGFSTSVAAIKQSFNLPAGLSAGVSTSTATLYSPGNWQIFFNGVERTDNVRPFDAVRIVNRIHEGSGTATIPIQDDSGALTFTNEMVVKVIQRDTRLFEGIVRTVKRTDRGWSTGPKVYTLEAQDYNTLLDDDVIETAFRSTTETDKARIAWLVSTHGTRGVTAGAEVQTILATMPPGEDGRPEQDFSGKTLREAIEDIAKLSGGRYYVDYDKKLHYFVTESITAPYKLSDTYNGTTSVGYWDLNLDDDSIDLVHEVLVVGTGVKIWRSIASPPAIGLRRRAVIRDEDITSVSQANEVGDSYLDQYGTNRNTGSVMTRAAGFRAGQTVLITHQGHGLVDASYVIAAVTAKTASPEEVDFALELNDAALDLGDVIGGQRRTIDVLAQQTTEQGATIRDLQAAGANLVPDSSFEAVVNSAWTVGTGWTYGATPTGTAFRGVKVGKLVRSAATAGDLVTLDYIDVDRSSDYWFSVWSRLEARTSGTARIELREYNAASTLLATTTLIDLTAVESTWTRHSLQFGNSEGLGKRAFQATTTKVKLAFNSAGASSTLTWNVDGVQIERGNLRTAYAPMPEELYNVPGEVVIDENGITIINGALTVKNPGGTVIIDGSSDHFRIAATGTTTLAGPDASAGHAQTNTSVTINTGFTYRPVTFMYRESGANALQLPISIGIPSGSATLQQAQRFTISVVSVTQTQLLILWDGWNINLSGSTLTFRYYIQEQVAI